MATVKVQDVYERTMDVRLDLVTSFSIVPEPRRGWRAVKVCLGRSAELPSIVLILPTKTAIGLVEATLQEWLDA